MVVSAALMALAGGSVASAASRDLPFRLCRGSEVPRVVGFDAATRGDAQFNRSFRHCFTTVDGVQLHYVLGGRSERGGLPPLLLFHGWPQSWYEWRGLLPQLAAHRQVLAVDLPGLGDSTGTPVDYRKQTLARILHGLAIHRGYTRVDIAGHDLGAGVGYAYTSLFPTQVRRLAVMDFPLPGAGCSAQQLSMLSYHFAFFDQPSLPEVLIGDHVRFFLAKFYLHNSPAPHPISAKELTEFTRTYRRPSVLHGGFQLYRTLARDQKDNAAAAASPLRQPVLLLTQSGYFEPEAACYRPGAPAVSGTDLRGAGHWLNEERRGEVLARLSAFFAS